MNNDKIFQDVAKLFKNLIKHTEDLTRLAKDIDTAKSNKEEIKKLGEWHVENRNLAKQLANDIPNCKGSLMFSLMKNNLREQIVIMTNLATNYQEQIELSIEDNDIDNLNEQINQLSEYYAQTKKMSEMFQKMTKK